MVAGIALIRAKVLYQIGFGTSYSVLTNVSAPRPSLGLLRTKTGVSDADLSLAYILHAQMQGESAGSWSRVVGSRVSGPDTGKGAEAMPEQEREQHDEVVERNIEGMRELLARKHERDQQRRAEPPLDDDANAPTQRDQLANDATGVHGSTGGIRNMGGGRP
jgi:hypothetical protein